MAGIFLCIFPKSASAEWLANWQYRKAITITGQSGAGTDFQMKLLIGESAGSSGANFNLGGNATNFPSGKGQGGDLFFTDNDGSTALSFWVESVSGSSPNRTATVWVKVADNLSSTQTIDCYYGNAGASNASSSDNTFLLFDDFDGANLDTGKWAKQSSAGGSVSLGSSQLTLSSASTSDYVWVDSVNTYSIPTLSETKVDSFSPSGATYRMGQTTGVTPRGDNGNLYSEYSADALGTSYRIVGDNASSGWSVSVTSLWSDTSGIWSFAWPSTGSQKFFVNYSQKLTGSDSVNSLSSYHMYLGNAMSSAGSSRVDWARVRKYVSTEPSVSSVASEESVSTCIAGNFSGGLGTEADPYHVATLNELESVRTCLDSHFIQTADIDASATSTWNGGDGFYPIGDGTAQFSGTYDGDSHVIDYLSINQTGNYRGLFGYIKGSSPYTAEVKNVGLTNATVQGTYMIGVLAGFFDAALIDRCYATGSVTSDALSLTDWTNAGGLAGRGYRSKIQNSWAHVTVTAKGYRNGGLVGQMWDDATDSSQILSSFSLGDVVGGSTYTGGLVGMMNGGIIRNSYARGDVTRSSGATSATFGAFMGGWYDDQSEVHTSYSTGNVYYAGTSDPTDRGFSGGSIANDANFFDGEVSNQSSALGATVETTVQMKTVGTFTGAGWDFGSVWGIESGANDGYPRLLASNERTLMYAAGTGGTVSGTTFQIVSSGSSGAAVTAVPSTGYHFVNWSDSSTDNPRTDTNVTSSVSVVANFSHDTFTLTYAAGTGGSLSGSATQTVSYGSDGSAVEAVPSSGYAFSKWSDDATDNPRTDTNITTDVSVLALFVDSGAPTISGASAVPTDSSVDITWNTDEASTSQVSYGLTSSLGSSTAKDSSLVGSHSVNIGSLHACARYFVRLVSDDAASNTATSSIFTFSTLGCDTSAIEDGGEEAVPTSGGTVSINTAKGTASLTIPGDFYASGGTPKEATFQINTLDTDSVSSEPSGTNLVGDNLFDLLAVSEDDVPITAFDKDITFVVHYGSDVQDSFEEGTLDVYRYSGGEWIKQNCTLDTTAHTLTCLLSHFSSYGVFGSETGNGVTGDDEDTSNDNNAEELKKADINSWSAFLYNVLVLSSSCPERVRLVITGHDFAKHPQVRIGGKKALWVERKSSRKIVAGFCLADLLKVKVGNKRSVKVVNPGTKAEEADKKIDLEQLDFEDGYESVSQDAPTDGSIPSGKEDKPNIDEMPEYLGAGTPNVCSYSVEAGDSLWSIAKQVYGDATAYPLIVRENMERYPDISKGMLHIGQSLVFGCDGSSGTPESSHSEDRDDTVQTNSEPEDPEDARWWNPLSWF